MTYNNNPMVGSAFIKRNVVPNEKAPIMKGFVSVSRELLEALLDSEADDRGNVKLEVSLWRNKNHDDAVSGTVQLPYKKREPQQQQQSKPRVIDQPDSGVMF